MKKYMAIAIVVLVLFVGYGCSEGDDSSPKVSSPEISSAEVVEGAKKNFLRVAKEMGHNDLSLARKVIHKVEVEFEQGRIVRAGWAGWKLFDRLMLQHTTPETQEAYHKYRSAVIKSQKVGNYGDTRYWPK